MTRGVLIDQSDADQMIGVVCSRCPLIGCSGELPFCRAADRAASDAGPAGTVVVGVHGRERSCTSRVRAEKQFVDGNILRMCVCNGAANERACLHEALNRVKLRDLPLSWSSPSAPRFYST